MAAGEYGYTAAYFAQMVDARAVDCLQADATRCGGYTGWLQAGPLAGAHQLPGLRSLRPQPSRASGRRRVANLRHVESFHDHHRIENLILGRGTLSPQGGALVPRRDVVGHGLTLRTSDATRYRVA